MKKEITLRQHIREGICDLFYIWKQEFRTTFRDQGVLIFFILVPLVYPLIYSFIYTNETLRDVPAVVVDDSRSTLSRQYVRMLDASPDIRVVAHCADMEEAKLALRNRDAYGIVYLPETFSDDIAAGRQTQVSIFCDMSGLMYYKAMLSANTEVSLEMNTEIKIARAGNTTDRQDEITAYPIEYKDVALYNPTNGFAAFLIPAVLILIIQQTLLLGIGLSAGTAREKNQFRDLVPINRHYNGTLRIVMGKGLSYFLVYALVSAYVLCVVPWLFSLNQIALPGELILFTLPYLSACIFFAMTASIVIGVVGLGMTKAGALEFLSGSSSETLIVRIASLIAQHGVLAAVLYAAVFGLTDTLVSWFNSENSVQMAQYAHTGMRMYFVGYFFAGFNIMAAGYLSAVNRPVEASITSICRGMVAIVACSLVLSAVFGMSGVWAAFPASELLTALLTLFLLRRKENGKA